MEERIVITSTGIVSALGVGKIAHLQSLTNGRSGLKHPRFLQTVHAADLVIGEVQQSDEALAHRLGLPQGASGYTRTTLLALLALENLFEEIPTEVLENGRLAFLNANTVGGMCSVENMYLKFISNEKQGDFIQYIDTLDCAESTQNISRHFGLKALTGTLSTACSSSANALIVGARMIQQGLVDKAICGGCDAMSRFTLNGFLSLKNVDKSPCKPFDANRNGLNLGEGAGYVLLEKEVDARARGAVIQAYFTGYANTNDAHHPTAPSPNGEGAFRTMQQALQKANISPRQIGYINAHGTATINNDISEATAIQQLFSSQPPPFSSTKPYTGHTLAAAGSIEAIFSIWCLQENFILPNLNFQTALQEVAIQPTTDYQQNRSLEHVLSNSFGFGGNNVSLIFSRR